MTLNNVRIITLPKVEDRRGNLSFMQWPGECPFEIKRVFYIYDVPADSERGGHSHHVEQQLIIALAGSFDVHLTDGNEWRTVTLNRPYHGLYIPAGIWRSLDNFTSGAICLTLSSTLFDETDYVRDYEIYRQLHTQRR